MALPNRLFLNAYIGEPDPGSELHPKVKRWVGKKISGLQGSLRPAELPDLSKWYDPKVGWGIVLPDNPALSPQEKATAIDAPEAIQRLLEARSRDGEKAPIYRYLPTLPKTKIRRYFEDGTPQDPDLVVSPIGIKPGAIPQYLLIYAPPSSIPWEFQYIAAGSRFVGRLDLTGGPLENYVSALIGDWENTESLVNRTVTWAVDHGEGDITHLMRRVVAYKLHKAFSGDRDIAAGALFLDGIAQAVTCEDLIGALEQNCPGLIITSSHGMTGPLDDIPRMAAQLGLPVDAHHTTLKPEKLLQRWSPDGAIWYAHACCSAGADAKTSYEGLITENSYADQVLKGVAKAGPCTSPLPRALLGAPKPLRAFIGHVEPTFDWTIRDRDTGQIRTGALVTALYQRLYQPMPIGHAFEPCHEQGPQLDAIHKRILRDNNQGIDRLEEGLMCQLIAQDLESLVILGDPTVALPPLGENLDVSDQ